MISIFKKVYHHMFKNYWFYNTLIKNINRIYNNPDLSDTQKGNQIYYDIFWKTWHQCNEPNLKSDWCSILDIGSFIKLKLSHLNWSYPKKKVDLLHNYNRNTIGSGIGKTIHGVQLDLNLWHFGNDSHLDACLNKAFK